MSINISNDISRNYLRINNSNSLYLNNLIPYDVSKIYSELEKKVKDDNINKIFIKNKFRIKNKDEFFLYFNEYNDTLLYKLINFYYMCYNHYTALLEGKRYNEYRINWDCNFGRKRIKSYYLSDIYKAYIQQVDNDFIKVINISMNMWNNLYLYYLDKSYQCYISINTNFYDLSIDNLSNIDNLENIFYLEKQMKDDFELNKNLVENKSVDELLNDNMKLIKEVEINKSIQETKINELENNEEYSKKFKLDEYNEEEELKKRMINTNELNKLNDLMNLNEENQANQVEDNNDIIDNIIFKMSSISEDNYILMFNYIEVITDNDNNMNYIFDKDFLNNNEDYPNILMKKENIQLKYELKDSEKINIIGWYITDEYKINFDNIDKINYTNTIKINLNKNLYIYILYEKN